MCEVEDTTKGTKTRHPVDIPYWKANTTYVTPFSVSGNPVLTLPILGVCAECEHWQPDTASVCRQCGFGFGVQIVGRRWEDEKLTAVGRVLEKLTSIKSRDRSLNIGKRAKL
jgi:Asp-tRNA(Asn)/Glu-tRNA(Gln) amidotransferase A subunit family amidase